MSRVSLCLLLLGLLVQLPPATAGEPLGRLLLTPAERHALDQQRRSNPAYRPAADGGERSLVIVGELRSSQGRHRRWHDAGDGAAADAVGLPQLPVGDRLHPASGRHERLWGNGGLRAGRNGAANGRR